MTLFYPNQYIQTTLSAPGGIDASQTTGIILQSVTGIETTKPGIALLDYQIPLDITKCEWIFYTSIDGSKQFVGVTRGQEGFSAKPHPNGCAIAFPISESHIANLNDEVAKIENPATNSFGFYNNSLYRQAIINGNFVVNQRVYVSGAVLAAGVYGHDRWKAGTSGGDYAFTQLASSTQITIAAGKSLIQVIEDKNVVGGAYTLSWTGTAQARYAINSATPAGAYAASPIAITGQTAGTVMSVEFNTGTLGKVNLNSDTVALPFMPKSYNDELLACQRYYETSGFCAHFYGTNTIDAWPLGNTSFKVTMRVIPTITFYSYNGTAGSVSMSGGTGDFNTGCNDPAPGVFGVGRLRGVSNFVLGTLYEANWTASAEL